MAKASPYQGNFTGGEFSPLLKGRVDAERYSSGLDTCENWIPTIQGGLIRRPGSEFIENAGSTGYVRLIPFRFSADENYVLEFSGSSMRVFKNGALVEEGGTPIGFYHPFLQAHLPDIKYAQSNDVVYLTHPSYPPTKVSRFSETLWSVEYITLNVEDGPYLNTNSIPYCSLPVNITPQITPSGTTGSITITGSISTTPNVTNCVDNGDGLIRITLSQADFYNTGDEIYITSVTGTTEANGTWEIIKVSSVLYDLVGSTFTNAYVSGGTARPKFFELTVNRLVRIKSGSTWGYARITGLTNSITATADVVETLAGTAAGDFRYGLWEVGNYPSCVVFHEDRLFFAGVPSQPQRIDGSCSGDYQNFKPTFSDGTTAANLALGFTLNSSDLNTVLWMNTDEKGLLVGTTGGEWVVRPSSQTEALSSTNISAKKATSYGSANIQAVQIGKSSLFIQNSARKVRELTYFYDVDGYQSLDMTVLSEHITATGIIDIAYQKEPQSILWCIRNDGRLVGMTYERTIDGLKVGFHRHTLGGTSDAAGTQAKVLSICVIPSDDGTREELWMAVQRLVSGSTLTYIERLSKFFEDEDEVEDAVYLDCSLTYDSPISISAITNANPGVVTANSHGFNDGDKVIFSNVGGMKELNGNTYTVANKTANTFQLSGINTTSYGTFTSGGEVRKKVTNLSGLNALEDETVSVIGDGAVQNDVTVNSGAATIQYAAGRVHVGYNYYSDIKQLRLEAGSADGTSIGKTRRIHRLGLMVHNTNNLTVGSSFSSLTRWIFRTGNNQEGSRTELFTGIKSDAIEFPYDFENQLCIRADQPLPATILAIMPQMNTQDR